MKDLMIQYKETAAMLYKNLIKIKNKDNEKNKEKYFILLSEYQHACYIHRQLSNYCKARGIL